MADKPLSLAHSWLKQAIQADNWSRDDLIVLIDRALAEIAAEREEKKRLA